MNNPKGFLTIKEQKPSARPVKERIKDWKEVYLKPDPKNVSVQAERCMDCAVPFCHKGCPLGNLIPEWNDLVYNNKWHEAYDRLSLTNNFPEFTGTLCPAPCEPACVLAVNDKPVTIKQIELAIIDRAFEEGWVKPHKPIQRTGKRVAIIGSGPAGLAAAQQLNRKGHNVVVFERADKIGGLLRYGIPDFKMEKWRLDRRLKLLKEEGIVFNTNMNIGQEIKAGNLLKIFDAVILAIGATKPRDLQIPGRQFKGIHFAMDYLTAQNKKNNGETNRDNFLNAEGKNVVIIGGGDTGSDCYGTAIRQGAKTVTQLQYRPAPSFKRAQDNPWPQWPKIFMTSTSQEEGGKRVFAAFTKRFIGLQNKVSAIRLARGKEELDKNDRKIVVPIPGSDYKIPADLVLLAMGFTGPETNGIVKQFGLNLTARGNLEQNDQGMTNKEGVFVTGDSSRGQSLIVWAIADGRKTAEQVDQYLSKTAHQQTFF